MRFIELHFILMNEIEKKKIGVVFADPREGSLMVQRRRNLRKVAPFWRSGRRGRCRA